MSNQPAVASVSWFTPTVIKFELEAVRAVEVLRKEFLGFRIQRIDRDGAVTEPLTRSPLLNRQQHAWPKISDKGP